MNKFFLIAATILLQTSVVNASGDTFLSIQNKINKAEFRIEQENIFKQYGLQKYYVDKHIKNNGKDEFSKELRNILSEIEMKEYANYVYSNISNIKKIAISIGIKENMSQKNKLEKVLDLMIDKIIYKEDKKNEDILKSINATFNTKLGDCEDQSILAAALLGYIGYEPYIFHRKAFFDKKGKYEGGHVFVGIIAEKGSHTFRTVTTDNKTIYLKAFELTGDNTNYLAKLKVINKNNKEVELGSYKVKAYNLILNK
ncbi:MAG: hypothetical protein MJK08_08995 [Campylobacterales bacterium]|nr:hypothetical protein [Campylobacterales bacterium]